MNKYIYLSSEFLTTPPYETVGSLFLPTQADFMLPAQHEITESQSHCNKRLVKGQRNTASWQQGQ